MVVVAKMKELQMSCLSFREPERGEGLLTRISWCTWVALGGGV